MHRVRTKARSDPFSIGVFARLKVSSDDLLHALSERLLRHDCPLLSTQLNQHPRDEPQSGVNIRASPRFLQARREVQMAIGTSGVPDSG
jgi:hypothetical protein